MCLAISGCSTSDKEASTERLAYPEPPRSDQVDDYHGMQVADPYRSLEDLSAPATKR